jgi:hypothetical protein
MRHGQRLDIFLCDATIILVGLLFFTMLFYAAVGKAERWIAHRRLMKRSKHDGGLLKLLTGVTGKREGRNWHFIDHSPPTPRVPKPSGELARRALLTGAGPQRAGTPTPPPSSKTTKG